MACNCATTEQLNELYRKYGEKRAEKKSFSDSAKNILYKIGIVLCLIPATPLLFIYVFYKAWGTDNHRINVMKFLRIKRKEIGTNVG